MLGPDETRWLGIAILLLLAAALAAAAYRIYRAFDYSPMQFPIYMFSILMTRILWRAQIEGSLPFAPGQGAVIVSNHVGPIDPAFVCLATRRPIHWLVASEYFKYPLFGWGFRTLQCVPVNRGGVDTAATKLAVRYAAQGEIVGMFPEGRINATGRLLLPGRPGAALIALKARVPVVPCYVEASPYDGTAFGFFFIAAKTRVKVGRPIDLAPYLAREGDKSVQGELTLRLLMEIAALAGEPNFEPELAGRQWKTAPVPA
ncbi:MAG TPA: lysophospholipid acyltransferase family protein [Pirellulales bacterium]|jgi:1-acyl-sn-glycerol-3-phosphate acyltransferase|nr:lysophospholipid acyltransferase family protein [Pirellulales bacterium]